MSGRPLAAAVPSWAASLTASLLLLGASRAAAVNDGLGEPPSDVDRSSPLATAQGFLDQARQGHFGTAAHDLWLDDVAVDQQPSEGARLARRLRFVLDRHPLDLGRLPREGQGGPGSVVLTTLDLDGKAVPVRLVRVRTGDSVSWLFAKDTVRAVDGLYQAYGPPFGDRLPDFLAVTRFGLELWQWLGLAIGLVAALVLGWLGEWLVLAALGRLTRLTRVTWDEELVQALRGPLKLPLWILVLGAVQGRLLLTPSWDHALGLLSRSLAIVATTWFVLRALGVAQTAVQRRLTELGTGAAAGTRTQMAVLWRVLTIVVYLLALAALLMQFEGVRTVGLSLLASAGVVGVVVGLAAQKSIGALFAGIQLSISQPIRIGDKVVLEGESGTVAEISLSYVVIRLWDNRHLVVPVSYFLEKPFQNWSRAAVDMVGAVLIQVDYRTDVAAVRAELDRILAGPGRDLWNRRLAKVQVTDTSEQTATLRLLVSADDSEVAFDLRCVVRESMLAFLRERPEWLPTRRLDHRTGEVKTGG